MPPTAERRLSLVRGDALHGIVDRAVAAALGAHLSGHPRIPSIQRALRREFLYLLRSEARSIRGTSRRAFLIKLERERNDILLRRDAAREELHQLRDAVGVHRELLVQGKQDFTRRVEAGAIFHEERLHTNVRELFERARAGEIDLDELQGRVDALAVGAARDERRRFLAELSDGNDRQIDLLERRIKKLNGSLEQSEAMLRQLESIKDVDEGVASIYRSVQGLSADELNAAQKRAMLEQIFEANLAQREAAHSA